jgi:diguanylate cyclase (GGDEF)-like protein/PAS domain S-box-containing protein
MDRLLPIAVLSPAGDFLFANENYLNLLGASWKEICERNSLDIFGSVLPLGEIEKIRHVLDNGNAYTRQICWRNSLNKPVWFTTCLIPVFTPAGKLERIVQFAVDVTARVTSEKNKISIYRKLSHASSRIGNAVAIADSAFKTIYVNPAFSIMFEYSRKELLDASPTIIFGPEGKTVMGKIRSGLALSRSFATEAMAYSKNGKRMWVSLLVNAAVASGGDSEQLIFSLTDITGTKLYETLQHMALEGLSNELSAPDVFTLLRREVERLIPDMFVVIFRLTEDGRMRHLACARALFTLAEENELSLDPGKCHAPVADSLLSESPVCVRDMRESGYPQSAKAVYAALGVRSVLSLSIRSSRGKVLGAVAFFYFAGTGPDEFHQRVARVMGSISAVVMEWEEKRSAVRELTFYNPVTGLPNLTAICASVERELHAGRLQADALPAAFCININRFRRITEIWGTAAGNAILKEVAQRILAVKGTDDLIAHSFLDEFVLFTFESDAVRARETAERIQSAFTSPFSFANMEIALSARISISLPAQDFCDPVQLIEQACTAVIQMHNTDRGQIQFYNGMAKPDAANALSLESRLLRAIEQDTLQLHYQPQVSLMNGEVCGMEALCRWREEDLGVISPSRFIPLAEEVGLIDRLSTFVLRTACRQLGDWRRRGVPAPAVSINLSALDFRNENLPNSIVQCLEEYGLSPSDLTVELTETALLDGNASTVDTVRKVHEAGVTLSLDDFGTGHSSLSYLRDLPIKKMKIDRSFVQDLHENELSLKLSKAIIRIGESLGLHVVAEGVENKAQLSLLKEQHYHAVQGYFLAKPMPAPELESWLENWEPGKIFP